MTYFEYPWGITVMQSTEGELLTVIIRNIEDERQDTVIS